MWEDGELVTLTSQQHNDYGLTCGSHIACMGVAPS